MSYRTEPGGFGAVFYPNLLPARKSEGASAWDLERALAPTDVSVPIRVRISRAVAAAHGFPLTVAALRARWEMIR